MNAPSPQILGDRPDQRRTRWIGRRVDVVAVETEAGFQPQAIARCQTNPHNALVGRQLLHQIASVRFGQPDFKAVLASVAGAAHEPVRLRLQAVHEDQTIKVDPCLFQRGCGLRPLKRKKDAVQGLDEAIVVPCNGPHQRFVSVGVTGICHHHEAVVAPAG